MACNGDVVEASPVRCWKWSGGVWEFWGIKYSQHSKTPALHYSSSLSRQTRLDGRGGCGCMRSMKTTVFAILTGLVLVVVGCVSTVNERKTAGVPFIKDRVEGRY